MIKGSKATKPATPVTWNLTDLFASDTDPEITKRRDLVSKKTAAFVKKWRSRTDYLEDPAVLAQALDEYEAWSRDYGYGGAEPYYFSLRFQQDQTDKTVMARYRQADDFRRDLTNTIRFFELNIAKIPVANQKRFLKHPDLQHYRHFLERAFAEAKYLLSEREETIMSMKSSTSYGNWVDMLESFLAKEEREIPDEHGKKVMRDFSTILNTMKHPKKAVRDAAAAAFNDILAKHAEVAEHEINSVLNHKKTDDTIRKIPRPDITRHLSDDMDTEVVDAIVESVSSRFDIPKRYYKLKAKLLGLPKLQYHERNVEYGHLDTQKYPWEQSVELIRRVFGDLDGDFLRIFDDFLMKGRFDVFPKKGKGGGAFCAHYLITQPTYILLNHTDLLQDVLTIAHEVGHGINNELIRERQHALYFGTPTSTAEVASTFMEDFVTAEVLKEADDELKLALMVMKIDQDVSTVFRQIACYRFETDLHTGVREKGYLSLEEIGELFRRNMAAYMGPAVEQSPGSQNWWVYWSHIRNYFYVYSYASGLLISKNLQAQVRKDRTNVAKVKEFLAAGYSASPRDIFLDLGIDIADRAFWDDSLAALDRDLKELERFAKKLGKT
jgi:oligoendopeptidase F